ncbi:hypothetical protein KKH59_01360 [Patescibacteria group bacterium]|nr:hypothetical protein [Patescibacteria group bacterium]
MDHTRISKIITAALIVAAFFAGTYSVDKAAIEQKGYDVGYSAGYKTAWDKATAIVDSASAPIFPQPKDIYSISGKIQSISASGNSLAIEADPVSSNPLSADSKPTIRTVKITPSTKIVKIKVKTPEEIQAMSEQNQTGQPTTPFSEEEITFSQLKQGDVITVTSDKNIKREMEIIALKIELQ